MDRKEFMLNVGVLGLGSLITPFISPLTQVWVSEPKPLVADLTNWNTAKAYITSVCERDGVAKYSSDELIVENNKIKRNVRYITSDANKLPTQWETVESLKAWHPRYLSFLALKIAVERGDKVIINERVLV